MPILFFRAAVPRSPTSLTPPATGPPSGRSAWVDAWIDFRTYDIQNFRKILLPGPNRSFRVRKPDRTTNDQQRTFWGQIRPDDDRPGERGPGPSGPWLRLHDGRVSTPNTSIARQCCEITVIEIREVRRVSYHRAVGHPRRTPVRQIGFSSILPRRETHNTFSQRRSISLRPTLRGERSWIRKLRP